MAEDRSNWVRLARELAAEAHAGQVRKAAGIPYFVHLDAVVATLVEHGYDDPATLAAAYLHDVLEDCPEYESRVRKEQPREVVAIVEALTEQKLDEHGHKRDKRARFEGYLANLSAGTEATRRALPISCADKIDNSRSIVIAEKSGHGLLGRLSTKPGEHEEQLRALRLLYAPVVNDALLAAFDDAVRALLETIAAWLPGRAVALAADAHLGRFDKAGAPYVYHPLRLMMQATARDEKMAAVLHDVVEDSRWSIEALRREGFPRQVVRAVDHLTRREGEDYDAFIERVAKDRLATRVKLLDLRDNADLSRIAAPTDEDRARVEKYHRAIARLTTELEKRSLHVVLDDESKERARALAMHPEVRGDHVTLVHRVEPASFSEKWIPGSGKPGERVEIEVRGQAFDERIQALAVAIGGTTERPYDRGMLHVTVSFVRDTLASEANALLESTPIEPLSLRLAGTIRWVDD